MLSEQKEPWYRTVAAFLRRTGYGLFGLPAKKIKKFYSPRYARTPWGLTGKYPENFVSEEKDQWTGKIWRMDHEEIRVREKKIKDTYKPLW